MGDEYISREEVLNLIDTAFESGAFDGRYAYENLIDAVQNLIHPLETDLISRQSAEEKLKKVVDEMALIFADIREKNVDDSVCGLCEYDCDHGLDGYAYECPGFERDDCFKLKEEYRKEWADLSDIPSVEQERKSGKWISAKVGKLFPSNDFKCSECGNILDFKGVNCGRGDANYCPNCGAKMEVHDGKENS